MCCGKYQVQLELESNSIYRFTCQRVFRNCIGKTSRNIITGVDEPRTKPDQAIYQRINDFSDFQE